jgi:hypothetical protein
MKPPQSPLENVTSVPDLANIDFQVPRLATAQELEVRETKTLQVEFNEVPISIDVKSVSYFKTIHQLLNVTMRITVSTKTEKNIAYIILIWM